MGKVVEETRNLYVQKVKPYKAAIFSMIRHDESVRTALRSDETLSPMQRLSLGENMINICSHYLVMNGIYTFMLRHRNEEALGESRKALSKGLVYFEEAVTPLVDAPFSEYEGNLARLSAMDAWKRYELVRKISLAVHLLQRAYTDNSKWKWVFVELEGRAAAITKNLFDLKSAVANTDPRSEFYEPTKRHLSLIKKLLSRAASRYRDRYEITSRNIEDFKRGLSFLDALKRVHIVLGESKDAEDIKKKAQTWTSKMETDMKRQKGLV